MKVHVSEFIVKYLERLGIDTIFGMPGAHILPVYDGLYESDIQSVLVKHEQGAAFMAGGYARVSGRVGACIATAGPGATNLVTGIANAYADKQPVLAITGEAPTYIFGKGGLQESSGEGGSIDQGALFKGITKYHRIIERTDYLAHVLNQTSKALLADAPGPVLLSLPYNVQQEMIDLEFLDTIKTDRHSSPQHHENPQIRQLVNYLAEASAPVIVAGYGCIRSGARQLLARLSEQCNIPVASSLKGKGSINEGAPYSLGSLGVTSSGYAYEYIVNRADLVLVLGASFNERTSYLWNKNLLRNKTVVQVDINSEQLEKVFTADLTLKADIKEVLSGVLQQLETVPCAAKHLPDIPGFKRALESRARHEGTSILGSGFALVSAFFERLNSGFPAGITVFDDNIIFAQNLLSVANGSSYYPNSGVSSLGHAIPAAIGAQFAGKQTTFVLIGDGGFQMCCMELMTAVNYGIPLNVVMFNNSTMGLIRKTQHYQYRERYIGCDFTNPDYARLARSFGIAHQRVATEADLEAMFATTDFSDSINLIEIMIDKDAFPNYTSRR
jgi:acetolactate synthase-1/2/3 large subunit